MSSSLLVLSNGFPDPKSKRYHCQFVYDQTKLVQDQFDEITVISPQPYFPSFLHHVPAMAGYSKLSGFHNYTEGNMRVFYPTYFTLPLGIFRGYNNFPMARAIKATIEREEIKYDLVHAHFLYPTGEAALSVISNQIPKILSLHGGDLYQWATDPNYVERARSIWRKYDRLHVPSRYLANVLTRLDPEIDKDKLHIIPPSVDSNLFFPSPKRANEQLILMVANLVDGKGHFDALEAFRRVLAKVPAVKLKIIGTGPLHHIIKRKIVAMKLENVVELVGPIAHINLPNWYRQAKLLLFPSYAESFGIVQIEAMACGVPVVAYANRGSSEVLGESSRFLVKIGDIDQLSQKIISVLDGQMESIESKKISEKYSATRISRQLGMLYSSHA